MWRVLVVFGAAFASAAEAVCRAISLEGGGSHGAYEVGAVWELVHSLPAWEVQWNVVTGISMGAINAGAMAQYAMGEETEMADFMMNEWLNLTSGKVYKNWPGGIAEGLLLKGALYDDSPALKTLTADYSGPFKRNITVGVTDMNTGLFRNFNESLSHSDLITAILASGSPPVFFRPVNFSGSVLADGGCLINLDVFAAINRCLDVVDSQADIIVDMIFDNTVSDLSRQEKDMNTLGVLARVRNINSYNKGIWYYYNAINAFPWVNFRFIILPSSKMPGGIVPLNFSHDVLTAEIAMGKADTQRALQSNADPRGVISELYHASRKKVRYVS